MISERNVVRLVTAVFLLSVCASVAAASDCPSGWIAFDDYCYQLRGISINDAKSWAASLRSCQGDQADLASIHSTDEQKFVLTMLRKHASNVASVFIGMNSRATASGYHWTDDSPVSYTHWKKGFMTELGMDCIAVKTFSGYWADRFCDDVTAYVCKKMKQGVTVTSKPKPPTKSSQYCRSGWEQYGSYCYRLSSGAATYSQARRDCQQHGGELTSISSLFEQAFVVSKVGGNASVWIGLNDQTTEGLYVWTDNKAVVYSTWAVGQPNSHSNEDDCVILLSDSGLWDDMPCTHTHQYMCKMPANQPTQPSTKGSTCPSGWLSYMQHCYLFTNGNSTNGKSFSDAESDCVSKNSHLVRIDDLYENAFIVKTLPLYADSYSKTNFMWIGLNDMQTEGLYEYTDHGPVTFTSWRRNQPDDFRHKEDCGHIYAYSAAELLYNGMWNDLNCNAKQGWICERRPDSAPPTKPAVPATMAPQQCSTGWTRFRNFCYNFNIPLRLGWVDARDRCLTLGADLVSIHSSEENQFVLSEAQKAKWKHSLWTGLSDRNVEGGYVWSDSSPVQYTYWNSYQPDNWKGLEDCVEMYMSGEWNDLTCSQIRHFACKIAVGSSVNLPAMTLIPSYKYDCDDGWVGHGPYCYQFAGKNINDRKTWIDAVAACNNVGANLTSITSLDEEEFVANYIQNLNDSSFTYRMWIGLSDRDKEGNFAWVDGSPMSFTYWNAGEPNNWQCFEDCGDLVNGYYWNDNQCTKSFGYICKKLRRGVRAPTTTVPQPSSYGSCPDGWSSAGGYCYLINNTAVTWPAAELACSSIGSHLASILTAKESTDLWRKLRDARIAGSYVWIGLNDRMNEHQYVWTDGNPVQVISWDRGQPDDYEGAKNCVNFNRGNGRWRDTSCDTKLPFVCKTTKVPYPSTAPPFNGTAVGCTTTLNSCPSCSKVACPANCDPDSAPIWGWQLYTADSSICLAAIHSGIIRSEQGGTALLDTVMDHGSYPSFNANGILSTSHGPAQVSFTVRSPTKIGCDPGWIAHNVSCYMVVANTAQTAMSRPDAQALCKVAGGDLVTITDHYEQAFLMSQLPPVAGIVWIGLSVNGQSNSMWNDNEPFAYSFWAPTTPSSVMSESGEHCVGMNPMGSENAGMWQLVSSCNSLLGYICEKAMNGSSSQHTTDKGSSGGLSGGAVAGIVISLIVGVVIAFTVVIVMRKRRKMSATAVSTSTYRRLTVDPHEETAVTTEDTDDDDVEPVKLDS